MHFFRIINLYWINSLASALASPGLFAVFALAKLVRFSVFAGFMYLLVTGIRSLGEFTPPQMVMFYLFFNLIDTTAQVLYREVYRFRPLLVSGGFDLVLVKPFPPLLRVLVGGPDFIDLLLLLIVGSFCVFFYLTYFQFSLTQVALALVLILNSLAIITSFHIFVLGFGIISLSVDHLVMFYRDLSSLMRIPVDFFTDFLRFLFTFVFPIGIAFTFPAKALFGLLTYQDLIISLLIGLASLLLSVSFWKYSLTKYQSASS